MINSMNGPRDVRPESSPTAIDSIDEIVKTDDRIRRRLNILRGVTMRELPVEEGLRHMIGLIDEVEADVVEITGEPSQMSASIEKSTFLKDLYENAVNMIRNALTLDRPIDLGRNAEEIRALVAKDDEKTETLRVIVDLFREGNQKGRLGKTSE